MAVLASCKATSVGTLVMYLLFWGGGREGGEGMLREQRSTYLSRSALLRGGSSHPRPFRGRPFARSDDLLAVLRVAVHFAHTRLGRHGILRIGSGELYVRGKLAPDELELLTSVELCRIKQASCKISESVS